MRKATITIGIIIVIAAGLLLFLRFLSPEDTWICDHGQWAKHGNPSVAKPTRQCGTNSTINDSEFMQGPVNSNVNRAVENSNTNVNVETSNANLSVTNNNQ